ncbi:MAG TPA: glycine zipper family protein, partial [Geobacteraceae bacterium]|nr:glycine zipper family protein [Geobacteraceae bacterium]
MTRFRMICLAGVAALLLVAGCSTYERKVVPFKMPSAYPNAVTVNGVAVASRAYDDTADARQAFGFDIRGAGVLPVQVIFDNQGKHSLEIIPEKTL